MRERASHFWKEKHGVNKIREQLIEIPRKYDKAELTVGLCTSDHVGPLNMHAGREIFRVVARLPVSTCDLFSENSPTEYDYTSTSTQLCV